MARESIRPLDPGKARSTSDPRSVAHEREAPDLAELLALARAQATEHEPSLACPTPPSRRLELPRFSGVTLADVQAMPPPPPTKPLRPQYVTAPLPPQPRVLLGPGAMTMTLAIVATLAFGVFVVTG